MVDTAVRPNRPALGLGPVMQRLRERKEWKLLSVLAKANRGLAGAWWLVLVLRGVLPAVFGIAMGILVGAVQRGADLAVPLTFAGVVFVLLQVLNPIHQAISANLGDGTAAWLYDRLTEACVRPPGMGHLEDPQLTGDLTVARDFDLGITGPPLSISMDFIAGGLAEMIGGLACAVVLAGYRWWAPLVLAGAWLATHWLLRESAVWRDRNTPEVRAAQRDSEYAYRLAVDPPAAKELRLFGLVSWTIDRFVSRRTRLHELQYEATRLREKPLVGSMVLVIGANVAVFWSLASAAAGGTLGLGALVVYALSAVGTSRIAFGGLNWAFDGAAAPVAAVLRLEPAMARPDTLDCLAMLRDQGFVPDPMYMSLFCYLSGVQKCTPSSSCFTATPCGQPKPAVEGVGSTGVLTCGRSHYPHDERVRSRSPDEIPNDFTPSGLSGRQPAIVALFKVHWESATNNGGFPSCSHAHLCTRSPIYSAPPPAGGSCDSASRWRCWPPSTPALVLPAGFALPARSGQMPSWIGMHQVDAAHRRDKHGAKQELHDRRSRLPQAIGPGSGRQGSAQQPPDE